MKLALSGRTLRPLRGRVVIRVEEARQDSPLWTPPQDGKDEMKIHHGTVLAFGPPAQKNGHDVEPGYKAGHKVLFVWTHQEKQWSQLMGETKLAWVPQENVVAVIE